MSSRTPVNGVGYDQSLLADAPQITKADKQEGYNPDLLEAQPNSRATPVLRGGATTPSKSKYAGASDDGHLRNAAVVQPPPTKTRSRKVIFIIIGAVLLVIVAVAVGVGVGVSKSHQQNGTVVPATQNGTVVPATQNGTIVPTTQGGQSDSSGVQTKPTSAAASTKDPTPSATSDGAGPGSVVGTDNALAPTS